MNMKSPEINDDILKLTGIDVNKSVTEKVCPFCQEPVDLADFTDEVSLTEHGISGLCQSCQNMVFSGNWDDEEDYVNDKQPEVNGGYPTYIELEGFSDLNDNEELDVWSDDMEGSKDGN